MNERQRGETHLLNIKPRPHIDEDFLAIRQLPLHVERAGQWHQDVIFSVGALRLGAQDAFVDGAHAVAELGLRGAQLGVRGGQVFEFRGEAGLQGAELLGGEGVDVD